MEHPTNKTYPLCVEECLDADMASNSIIHGSLDKALFHNTSYYACDYNVSRGVWYHHPGDGSLLTVEACSTDFEVEVAIFAGNCIETECLGVGDRTDDCVFYAWPTSKGEEYSVLVHSMNENAMGDYYVDFDSLKFVS